MDREQLIAELSPFADIGDSAIRVTDQAKNLSIRMTRDGRPLKISIDRADGKIKCAVGALEPRSFSSFKVMLASEIFSNLRRWSHAQRDLLRKDQDSKKFLPINCRTHEGVIVQSVDKVDEMLGSSDRKQDSVEILLIDGPAGIGKTSLIEQLARRRAETYQTSALPLILHVKSRGRVLSNLQDLMAFSLQTIRSQITYDQIPVLAKYGLVVIAIDGFDELADPNGYQLAWAQLGELITFVRGQGTLILAGRDTFIGRNRLLGDVKALRSEIDVVTGLTLSVPTADQAKIWLRQHQWTDSNFEIPSISVLLEDESFALRPVFLRMLAEHVKPKALKDKHERYLTPLLVNHMIEREAGLFGAPVEAVMKKQERENFLRSLLCEVARQMADAQVEALEASEIGWLCEAALGDGRSSDVVNLLKHRASLVAFFVNDERQGYRTFLHSYLLSYFLSMVTIDAVGSGDIPKFIRRNILGSEFLSIFSDVAAESAISSRQIFLEFWRRVSNYSLTYTGIDRSLRNCGALALAGLSAVNQPERSHLREFDVDDAVVKGSCPASIIENVRISQIDCRGADLSSVEFRNVSVVNLIADDFVRVSQSFPDPVAIIVEGVEQSLSGSDVTLWLDRHGRSLTQTSAAGGLASVALKKMDIYKLLSRAARLRQYWLRADGDDIQANKIVRDPNWEPLSKLLQKHGYLRVETRQASGTASDFFHIKHRESILAELPDDESLRALYDDMSKAPIS